MTQPATPQAPTPAQQQEDLQKLFAMPRHTLILEQTQNVMKIVNENGQPTTVIEHKTHIWKLGGSVPEDDKTTIVAIFRKDNGDARIYVQPKPGSQGAEGHLAYRLELSAVNIRFAMETMNDTLLQEEIQADVDYFILGIRDGGEVPPGEPEQQPADGQQPPAVAAGSPQGEQLAPPQTNGLEGLDLTGAPPAPPAITAGEG